MIHSLRDYKNCWTRTGFTKYLWMSVWDNFILLSMHNKSRASHPGYKVLINETLCNHILTYGTKEEIFYNSSYRCMSIINTKAAFLWLAAIWQAGPLPIELPHTIMSLSSHPHFWVKNFTTCSASESIFCALSLLFCKSGYIPYPRYSIAIMCIHKYLCI